MSVEGWLEELASGAPTPGGGAAAAVNAAIGAALISMVCNLTLGKPKYSAHRAEIESALAQATVLRRTALDLADADAEAFAAVIASYRLPRATPQDVQARDAAIQAALVDAADVPVRTAAVAASVIQLAGAVVKKSNVNVISDVAGAALSARCALDAAAVNVEINLAGIKDPVRRRAISDALAAHMVRGAEADLVVEEVRKEIGK